MDEIYFESELWRAHELCDKLKSNGDFNIELISDIFQIIDDLWRKTLEAINKY